MIPKIESIPDRELREFTAAYCEAMYFADSPEEWEGLAERASVRYRAFADCAAFLAAHGDDVRAYGVSEAGHDFWLTRNRHGAGFWEEDHGTSEVCARLDAAAKACGEVDLYLDDAGYLEVA